LLNDESSGTRSESVLVMESVNAQRVAVSSTDWLDGLRGFISSVRRSTGLMLCVSAHERECSD